VRSGNTATGPWTYTVQPHAEIADGWNFESQGVAAYDEIVNRAVKQGEFFNQFWSLEKHSGWYSLVVSIETDPTFLLHFAGHLETGQPSRTDPQIDGLMVKSHRPPSSLGEDAIVARALDAKR
jgi:hypothetical protein